MKYKLKLSVFQIIVFVCFWLIDNYYYIPVNEKITDASVLCNRFMNVHSGYNDSIFRLGIVITIFFITSFFSYFKQVDSSIILRYNRDKFVLHNIKEVIVHSFLFSFEYWGINIIFIIAFCNMQMLIDYYFFYCAILYFLTRYLYFLLCGMLLLFFELLLLFKKQYVYIASFFILGINSFPYLMLDRGIILFADFVNEWMKNGKFDLFTYIKNSFVCLLLILIFAVGSRIVFTKKDILLDEEEN